MTTKLSQRIKFIFLNLKMNKSKITTKAASKIKGTFTSITSKLHRESRPMAFCKKFINIRKGVMMSKIENRKKLIFAVGIFFIQEEMGCKNKNVLIEIIAGVRMRQSLIIA